MTVYAWVGTIGAGKTCCMTASLVDAANKGNVIYANYNVKGVKVNPIDGINDLKNIGRDLNDKDIFLDELWLTADSHNSFGGLAKFAGQSVLQSRKVKADVHYTTQHFGQVVKRIRDITEIIHIPKIIAYSGMGKPAVAKISSCKSNLYGDMYVFREWYLPLYDFRKKRWICDLYDTYEIVEGMDDPEQINIKKIAEKYKNFRGDKAKLISTLVVEEGVAASLAKQIASYVLD